MSMKQKCPKVLDAKPGQMRPEHTDHWKTPVWQGKRSLLRGGAPCRPLQHWRSEESLQVLWVPQSCFLVPPWASFLWERKQLLALWNSYLNTCGEKSNIRAGRERLQTAWKPVSLFCFLSSKVLVLVSQVDPGKDFSRGRTALYPTLHTFPPRASTSHQSEAFSLNFSHPKPPFCGAHSLGPSPSKVASPAPGSQQPRGLPHFQKPQIRPSACLVCKTQQCFHIF